MNKHIMCVGKICGDDFEWHFNMPPIEDDGPTDGSLQATIDEAEQTEDYEDYLIDVEYMRSWH